MKEHDERFADSGLAVEAPMTRRSALKLGTLGVLGAAAAAYLPGRARASGITLTTCRAGQGFKCGTTLNTCGGPGSGCGCAFQYTGSKLANTQSFCVDFNVCCSSLATCPGGQSQCPGGTICSATTCCPEPVCMPACGANVPPPNGCQTPAGCSNPGSCSNPGGFSQQCGTGISCGGIGFGGCYCFVTAEGGSACGQNMFCEDVCTCVSSADCPSGNVCIVETGCNCGTSPGVCVPLCGTCNICSPVAPVTRIKSGATTAIIKH